MKDKAAFPSTVSQQRVPCAACDGTGKTSGVVMPCISCNGQGTIVLHTHESGMTLRQWYAGMAMQGILAREGDIYDCSKDVAETAFRYADAMLKEGEK